MLFIICKYLHQVLRYLSLKMCKICKWGDWWCHTLDLIKLHQVHTMQQKSLKHQETHLYGYKNYIQPAFSLMATRSFPLLSKLISIILIQWFPAQKKVKQYNYIFFSEIYILKYPSPLFSFNTLFVNWTLSNGKQPYSFPVLSRFCNCLLHLHQINRRWGAEKQIFERVKKGVKTITSSLCSHSISCWVNLIQNIPLKFQNKCSWVNYNYENFRLADYTQVWSLIVFWRKWFDENSNTMQSNQKTIYIEL